MRGESLVCLAKPSEVMTFQDPRIILFNLEGPNEREAERLYTFASGASKVLWVSNFEKARKEVRGETVFIAGERDKAKAYHLCREFRADPRFKMMLLTDHPEDEEAIFNGLDRYVCAGSSQQLALELAKYLPPADSFRKAMPNNRLVVLERQPPLSSTKHLFLKKGSGRLVWNMEQNHQVLRQRSLEIPPIPFRRTASELGTAYL